MKKLQEIFLSSKEIRIQFWFPCFLFLSNFILKGIFLTNGAISEDEPFSIYHAQMNVPSIIAQLSTGNNPPFFEIFLHYWIKLFGISAFSVRFPSLFFNSITVLFIYKIGVRFFNLRIAITASLFFIFSNYQILYAHQARVYSLKGMLSAISMYYFLCITCTKKRSALELIIYVLTNTILIYAHYFGIWILIIQSIFLLLNKKLFILNWKSLSIAFIAIVVLYIPFIKIVFERFLDSSHGTWVKPPSGIESLYNMLWEFCNAPVITVIVIIVFIMAILLYLFNENKTIKKESVLIILWFTLPFFVMFFVSFYIPMFSKRYLMFVSIGFYIVLALAVNYLVESSKYLYVLPFVMCVLFMISADFKTANDKGDVRKGIEKFLEMRTNNTVTYLSPDWFEMNFSYYYNLNCFKNYNEKDIKGSINKCLHEENIYPIENDIEIDTNFNKKFNKILFIDANYDYQENKNLLFLKDKYKLIDKQEIEKTFTIYEFAL